MMLSQGLWTVVGATSARRRAGRCDCCDEPNVGERIIVSIGEGDDREVYVVGLDHAARYLGRSPEDVRAEVDRIVARARESIERSVVVAEKFPSMGHIDWYAFLIDPQTGRKEMAFQTPMGRKRDALHAGQAVKAAYLAGEVNGPSGAERAAQEALREADDA